MIKSEHIRNKPQQVHQVKDVEYGGSGEVQAHMLLNPSEWFQRQGRNPEQTLLDSQSAARHNVAVKNDQ